MMQPAGPDPDPRDIPDQGLGVRPTADGTRTLYSRACAQTYHSRHGAVLEARHVFLEGTAYRAPARVLEVGFGTGLNFLVTAVRAQGETLHYTALERTLPSAEQMCALDYGEALGVRRLWAALVDWRRSLPLEVPAGKHLFTFGGCRLDLVMGDATNATLPPAAFNAVYLDPFSPQANPELWTPDFLALLFRATAPGGLLATYSAAGNVRRGLAAAGFEVRRKPGPPGKREFLTGLRAEPPP